ncbi:MAG TPA: hypothetical protein VEP49_09655 [Acidimicrobiia bacterium]|nr:hypothetical protein [Acidimicrobiia bacterium]
MQPFERLRRIARHPGDDRTLVAESADCLAEFDADPAGLVVTCRRLLHHHPDCAPLWWLCARVLAAPDPSDAAWEAERLVRDDRTPARLAALLPFPHDRPIAVLGWPELAGEALESRPDLEVLAVRRPHADDHWRRRLSRSDAAARPVDSVEASVLEPSHVLVEIEAGSPSRALVLDGTAALLEQITKPTTLVWLVAGVGRVLPARLFDAMAGRLDPPEDHGLELVDVQVADRIAGPAGLERPEHLQRRVDAPVAPELLRLD